ncbi:MAG: transketolase family protein [Candidatus Latescibacteria bacterium]|nr:transketolase family protein [Candidatus Latescibacterota bacterium]
MSATSHTAANHPAQQTGQANLEVFSQTLLELGRRDPSITVVTSDSRGSAKLGPFAEALPSQVVEVGIAEQNLVGIAAGLASTGKKVFAVSPACFLTARALEQIKNDVCYSDNPVNVVGISAGVSYGALGSTHHSLHDLAALRAINNIDIVVPADNFETRSAIRAAADQQHPIYLRFGKRPMAPLYAEEGTFQVGKALCVRRGTDIAFIATGETVHPALAAAELLDPLGVSCRVLSMHTIKPLDRQALIDAASQCRALITVEEHSVYGGLGEACAAVLLQEGIACRFRITGIPDEYTITGSQQEIFGHYGLSAEGLAKTAKDLL